MANTPRISTWANQASYIELPGFTTKSLSIEVDAALQQFEGDTVPRLYRGTARPQKWSLDGIFPLASVSSALALKQMFEDAFTGSDPRLCLVPGGLSDTLAPGPTCIAVFPWTVDGLQRPSGITIVSFTATQIAV